MKNRTVIGIVCMIAALALMFVAAPLVNRLTSDTTLVLRLSSDVKQGAEITEDKLEAVNVKTDTVPEGIINDPGAVIGKYASTQLYAGDYLNNAKITDSGNTANDMFASLSGDKVAVSITFDSFASGLSGKLKNGDIISIIVNDKETGKAIIPGELKYMKVITTTTDGGIEQDAIVKNEDGSYDIPTTVTLLANTEQAKLLAEYDSETVLTCALVYRGNNETSKKFLDIQDDFFLNDTAENEENGDTAESTDGGEDIIRNANDIINGKADYYDVQEAADNG
ncbi:MAG: pilus assembly protein CpaB [Clostridia bacterium]|nr:pilus assembly protein CpaB [Clostridia bacterium]